MQARWSFDEPEPSYAPPKNLEHVADGILKPGVYRIQNRESKQYLDIKENSNILYFRQVWELTPQDALVISVQC